MPYDRADRIVVVQPIVAVHTHPTTGLKSRSAEHLTHTPNVPHHNLTFKKKHAGDDRLRGGAPGAALPRASSTQPLRLLDLPGQLGLGCMCVWDFVWLGFGWTPPAAHFCLFGADVRPRWEGEADGR